MKQILLIIFLMMFTNLLFAQIQLSGKITDKNNKPLDLVEVLLFDRDTAFIKSELTNERGDFRLEIKNEGEYVFKVIQFGKELYNQKIIIENNVALGTIKVIENSQQLQEVTITSKKKLIERKVDRLVFNVENSISATGGDAIDALLITPSIRVQNDQIAMIGKSNMSVMVDDRLIQLSGEDLINFLRTIQSDNIKSIEVITTPPAKYDAEGNSGLVNIKLKKNKKDSWNTVLRTSYIQRTYPTGSLGGNFSYKKNKLNLLLDVSYTKGSALDKEDLTFFYPTETWNSINKNKASYAFFNSTLNLNYKLTKKTDIGVQYLGGLSKLKKLNSNRTTIKKSILNNYIYEINTIGDDIKESNNSSININSTTTIDSLGKKFSIDLDYFNFKVDKNKNFDSYNNNPLQSSSLIGTSLSYQDINNYSAKIDFDMPYEFVNLSFGSKINFTNNNSDAFFFNLTSGDAILDPSQSNVFSYKENTQALYISANKKLSEKWESKFGLRMEATQTIGASETLNQVNKNNYIKFFPSAYLSYKPDEKNVFNLSYSRRVGRPSYWEMNPFRWYDNPNLFSEGNPFLQPSFTNNFQISHSYNNILNSTIYVSKVENGFGQLSAFEEIDGQKIQKFLRLNYFNQTDLGFDVSITSNFFSRWTCFADLTVYYSETNTASIYVQPKSSGWGANFTTTNTITLNKNKTFFAELSYTYFYPTLSGIYTISDYSSLNFGFKIVPLNKRLQISANIYDVFSSDRPQYGYVTNGIKQLSKNYSDKRYLRISLKYNFGNSNISVKNRGLGNQDEKNRAGK